VTGHATSVATSLHEDVAPLAFLLGRWAGEGEGFYPTIEPFSYGEEITVSHVGKPFLAYAQRTWNLDDGRPLHAETGYWRCPSPTGVELVVAHPNGLVEVSEGPLAGRSLELTSTTVAGTASAKEVNAVSRRIRVAQDRLEYDLDMAAVGVSRCGHLHAVLRRVAAAPG
jgi:THAP4-like, heme-binding beta-barrel domain